ncbi:unnamed protein product [Ranitomeya imitator]|uniref:TH1 domain-containing protein n=1 Tax=Ranitomeya imitator TaxID=111125 RepID=A0ABN9L2B3_9NEOB|nr:unnamed protein product [Ranitomeya imitator]
MFPLLQSTNVAYFTPLLLTCGIRLACSSSAMEIHAFKLSMHKCKKYRDQFTEQKKFIYDEKLEASELFKEKKSLYPASVGQQFQGDYLEISKSPKYKKLSDAIEDKIIIADCVSKVNRANGKGATRIFLLTKSNVIIADHKSGQIKLEVPLGDVTKVSMSSQNDGFFALHLKEGSAAASKGDFLFSNDHLIEMATKLYRTTLMQTKQKIIIEIADEYVSMVY